MPVRALIFDVDGTLAETEEIHRAAFNAAFAEAGIGWFWTVDMYARLLKVTGGRERIAAYGDEIGSLPGDIPALHRRKTDIYNERIRSGGIALRPGVERLIRTAREHELTLAIATTTSRPNVISLIAATLGESAVAWFASIRTGEDVSRKKPDPEVFNLVLADLGLAAADCCGLRGFRQRAQSCARRWHSDDRDAEYLHPGRGFRRSRTCTQRSR